MCVCVCVVCVCVCGVCVCVCGVCVCLCARIRIIISNYILCLIAFCSENDDDGNKNSMLPGDIHFF